MAADACRALDLSFHNGSVSHHTARLDPDERIKAPSMPNMEVRTGILLVSESGLYKLIMRSDKPQAKAFQDWVTRDVLPAVRKDGAYVVGEEKVKTGEMSEDEFILRAMQILEGKSSGTFLKLFPRDTLVVQLNRETAMGMIELRGLRELHRRMHQHQLRKIIFPYRVNRCLFTVLFAAVGEPYELALTANAANVFILVEVHKGYRISRGIDHDAYEKLARFLRIDGRAGNKLIPAVFFAELDSFMGGQEVELREPTAQEILSVRQDLPYRDLPYFWHWIDQDVRNQHVTRKNLIKTRLILGPDAELFSLRNNVSSRWTNDIKKATDWSSSKTKAVHT